MDLYWRQGFVIKDAKSVRDLPLGMVAKLEAEEQCRVYRNFTTEDEGKSRKLVGVFTNSQDAALAVKLHNATLKDAGL
jgi:hypothetical protein